eukprot:scaffold34505_cov124-Isochrysis_galbana.AAC.1
MEEEQARSVAGVSQYTAPPGQECVVSRQCARALQARIPTPFPSQTRVRLLCQPPSHLQCLQ